MGKRKTQEDIEKAKKSREEAHHLWEQGELDQALLIFEDAQRLDSIESVKEDIKTIKKLIESRNNKQSISSSYNKFFNHSPFKKPRIEEKKTPSSKDTPSKSKKIANLNEMPLPSDEKFIPELYAAKTKYENGLNKDSFSHFRDILTLSNHQKNIPNSNQPFFLSEDKDEHSNLCGVYSEDVVYNILKHHYKIKGYEIVENDLGLTATKDTSQGKQEIKLTWFNKPYWYGSWTLLRDRKKFISIQKQDIPPTAQDLQEHPNTLFFEVLDDSSISVYFWVNELEYGLCKVIKQNNENQEYLDDFKNPNLSYSTDKDLIHNLIELITAGTNNPYDFVINKKTETNEIETIIEVKGTSKQGRCKATFSQQEWNSLLTTNHWIWRVMGVGQKTEVYRFKLPATLSTSLSNDDDETLKHFASVAFKI